jgi:putative transposase
MKQQSLSVRGQHSAGVTSANVHDSKELGNLLHDEESRVYEDSACRGQKDTLRQIALEAKDFTNERAYLTKARASFPNDEAAIKLLYLALRNISKPGTMPIQNWKQVMSQLMIRFETQNSEHHPVVSFSNLPRRRLSAHNITTNCRR